MFGPVPAVWSGGAIPIPYGTCFGLAVDEDGQVGVYVLNDLLAALALDPVDRLSIPLELTGANGVPAGTTTPSGPLPATFDECEPPRTAMIARDNAASDQDGKDGPKPLFGAGPGMGLSTGALRRPPPGGPRASRRLGRLIRRRPLLPSRRSGRLGTRPFGSVAFGGGAGVSQSAIS